VFYFSKVFVSVKIRLEFFSNNRPDEGSCRGYLLGKMQGLVLWVMQMYRQEADEEEEQKTGDPKNGILQEDPLRPEKGDHEKQENGCSAYQQHVKRGRNIKSCQDSHHQHKSQPD